MPKYEGPTAGTEVKYRGRTWILSHRVEGMPGELLGNWWAECVEDGQMGIISGLWALKQWNRQQTKGGMNEYSNTTRTELHGATT